MKLKSIISLFLALVLATQILPLQQVGRLLSSNQIQEEIPHSMDAGKVAAKEIKPDLFHSDHTILSPFLTAAANQFFSFNVALPAHFVGEIQTPPPNFPG